MIRAPQQGRRWRWRSAITAATLLAVLGLAAAFGLAAPFRSDDAAPAALGRALRHRPAPASAALTIPPRPVMTPIPRSYLGLSTEYWALPLWGGRMRLLERVLSLLRVPGGGPLVLRVGGDSADHSFWDPHDAAMPAWAFGLEPSWLAQARRLVADLGVRLILDLNLITDTPATALQWARAAEAALPRGSIAGFEIGNEPDIYTRSAWLAITSGRQYLGRPLPRALTPRTYVRAFRTFAAALEAVAPRAVLAGPALARPRIDAGWVDAVIRGDRHLVGLVTVHRYPYSACAHRGAAKYPTVRRLLSARASAGVAASVAPDVEAAHDAGLPVRMTELNSVTCGGLAGVSDTFATALWAPETLFDLVRAGVDGVNLHVRADMINAPFALTGRGLVARPLLYGLMLFARALGPRARLVRTSLRAPAGAGLQADVVRVGADGLRCVLIDERRRSLRVSLRVPATGDLSVQRLSAPGPGARRGVTLGGRWLNAGGSWQGAPKVQAVAPRRGRYTIIVPGFSAALVSGRAAPGALGAPTGARRWRAAGSAPPGAPAPRS